jgi:NDP-sugar pyrophosphorylase family protein
MNMDSVIPKGTKAVILAGGKGTRLAPYTTVLPKPLMPVGDQPILEILLKHLSSSGIRDIVISVGHLAELIVAFFQKGEKWGINIDYAIEDYPLGTMGPLSCIEGLGSNFFVMNGDILTDLDFNAMYSAHVASGAVMTVATHRREVMIDFGVIDYDSRSLRITSFQEKPVIPHHVSMGVYILSRKCLEYIPKGEYFGFDQLMLNLLEKGEKIQSFPHDGKWLDIGRPEDYLAANRM